MKKNLYFKQGFKTIMKSKIQLVVILILAFLFSFFLTSWLTVTENFTSSYNDIVTTYTKPDYVYSEKVTNTSAVLDEEKNQFIPLYDLIESNDAGDREFLSITDPEINESETAVNFILTGDKTFISKTFDSNEFKNIFKTLFQSEYGNLISHMDASGALKISDTKYQINPDFIFFDESIYSEFVSATTFELLKEYVNDLKNDESYLNDTVMKKYFTTDKEAYNKFVNSFSSSEDVAGWMADEKLFNSDDNFVSSYIYNALQTLPIVLITNLNNFFIDTFQSYVSTLGEGNKPTEDGFNNFFNGGDKPMLGIGDDKVATDQETGFEFLFGKELEAGKLQNEIYKSDFEKIKTSFEYGSDPDKGFEKFRDLEYRGCYGYTNQFTIKTNETNKISGIVFDENNYAYSQVPIGKTYSSSIGGLNNNISKTVSYVNKNLSSIRFEHFNFVAKINNINFELREESFTFDPIAKINYRFVVVDDWKKIKLISGDKPNDESIFVSEQFKDQHQNQTTMKINNLEIPISGTASDALSYLQIADIDLPVVDKDQSCIIYVSKKMLQKIFNNPKGDGLTTNFSNNFFISGEEKNVSNFFSDTFWNNENMIKDQSEFAACQNFKSSNWNLNWSIISKIKTVLILIGLIAFVSIIAIVFYTLGIVIGKCIRQNKDQLQNLLVQGVGTKKISVSYLGYCLLILFVSFVPGFVLGSLLQPQFIKWFTSYAVIERSGINFSWLTFLVLFFVFGGLILLVNYFSTYVFISKLKFKKANTNNKILISNLKKINLKIKLNWFVISRGKVQLFTIGILILVSSLLMSSFEIFISSFNRYIYEEKNIINYNNEYNMNDPIYNIPFSKKTISAWDGFGSSLTVGSELENNLSTVYNSIDKYEDSVNASTIIPKIIYNGNDLEWITQYVAENNNFIDVMSKVFLNNAANVNEKSFSIGTFEQFENYFVHALQDSTTGEEFDDTNQVSSERLKKIAETNSLFENFIPMILKSLFGNSDIDFDNTDDWRELLLDVARALLPNSFSKQYVTQERKTQFYFEMNSENYLPDQEYLATVANVNIGDSSYKITGLNKNQTAININSDPFISDEDVNRILLGESVAGVYDASSQQLTIPVVANKNKEKSLSSSSQLQTTSQALALQNNSVIPTDAWSYLNYAEANSQDKLINASKDEWLKISETDTSKFNYFNSFDQKNNLNPSTQFYVDNVVEDGVVKKVVRPYYNYNDVMLFVPKSVVPDVKDLYSTHNYSAALGRRYDIKSTINQDTSNAVKQNWYGSIDNNLVPDFAKQAWGDKSGDYWWVAPYNLNYDYDFKTTSNGQVGLTDVLFSNLNTWIDDAVSKMGSPLKIVNDVPTIPNVKNVKLKVIDTINSYDRELIIADQKLINLIEGYGVENVITKPTSSVGEIDHTYQSGSSQIDVYELKTMGDIMNEEENLATLQDNNYVVQKWFNTKLSKVDEPLNLTAGMSGSLNNNVGIGMLFHDGINSVKSGYKNVDLVSVKLRTVISVSEIAFSIGLFIVIALALICALVIFIISDLFAAKYTDMLRFLKITGYNRWEQTFIVMMPQIVFAIIEIIIGVFIPLVFVQPVLNLFDGVGVTINVYNPWYLVLGVIVSQLLIFGIGNLVAISKITRLKTTGYYTK
jgi:putative ABC transport system permease protein